jgi:hypothetical protein
MAAAALTCIQIPSPAQTSLNSLSAVVNVVAPEKIVAKRNSTQEVPFTISVRQGYHINSDKPEDDYLIPLKVTFGPGMLELVDITFPKPQLQKFPFSEKPMSVFDGSFKTIAKVRVPPAAPAGATQLVGKVRYQACNDRMCLPPRTLEVKVPVEIRD